MPARVKVNLGYTISMGPGTYEFLRIDYGLEADAKEGETIGEAFERVENFVSDKLFSEVKKVKEGL